MNCQFKNWIIGLFPLICRIKEFSTLWFKFHPFFQVWYLLTWWLVLELVIHSFLLLSSISWYGCIILSLPFYLLKGILAVLPITDNVIISIHVQVFVWTLSFFFSGFIPRSEIAEAYKCLVFWGNTKLFPKCLYHFVFLLAVSERSRFSEFLPAYLLSLFYFRCFSRYVRISHCILNLRSLMANDIECLFVCLFAISVSMVKSLCTSFTFLNCIVCLFIVEYWELLYTF